MKTVEIKNCECMNPAQIRVGKFSSKWIGIDDQQGRFGEVSIDQCLCCQRLWLHYFVEYEHLSQSGRWYRGIITQEVAQQVTPENAVEILNNLEWHLYGGSYFFNRFGKGLKSSVYVS